MLDPDVLPSLAVYRHVVATRCLTFVGFTILVYDHVASFPDEVAQIWSRPKNAVSLMFLFNRYATPLILMVDIYEKSGLASPLTRSFCSTWLLVEGYLVVLIFSIVHGLIAMRVCALYERKTWVMILLKSSWIAYVISMLTLVTLGLVSMSHNIRPVPQFNICFAPITMSLWVVWLPSLIFECLIFSLTIVRVVKYICRDVSMPITNLMYRDGIIYFMAMSSISLFCLLDWLVAPATLNGLTKYFGYAVCVCASSKLVLNLRALAPTNDLWSVSYDLQDSYSIVAPLLTASIPVVPRSSNKSQSSQRSATYDNGCIETIQRLPRVASIRRVCGSQHVSSWSKSTRSSTEAITSGLFSDLYQRPHIDTTPSSASIADPSIPMASSGISVLCRAN